MRKSTSKTFGYRISVCTGYNEKTWLPSTLGCLYTKFSQHHSVPGRVLPPSCLSSLASGSHITYIYSCLHMLALPVSEQKQFSWLLIYSIQLDEPFSSGAWSRRWKRMGYETTTRFQVLFLKLVVFSNLFTDLVQPCKLLILNSAYRRPLNLLKLFIQFDLLHGIIIQLCNFNFCVYRLK